MFPAFALKHASSAAEVDPEHLATDDLEIDMSSADRLVVEHEVCPVVSPDHGERPGKGSPDMFNPVLVLHMDFERFRCVTRLPERINRGLVHGNMFRRETLAHANIVRI